MNLDNRLVARYFPPVYYLSMTKASFRDRALVAFKASGMTKAELARKSKVPYHAIDKLFKREGASTSTENAQAIAQALGITVDGEAEYDALRDVFFQLDEVDKLSLMRIARGLLK